MSARGWHSRIGLLSRQKRNLVIADSFLSANCFQYGSLDSADYLVLLFVRMMSNEQTFSSCTIVISFFFFLE